MNANPEDHNIHSLLMISYYTAYSVKPLSWVTLGYSGSPLPSITDTLSNTSISYVTDFIRYPCLLCVPCGTLSKITMIYNSTQLASQCYPGFQ